jgi:hypothetical protein
MGQGVRDRRPWSGSRGTGRAGAGSGGSSLPRHAKLLLDVAFVDFR